MLAYIKGKVTSIESDGVIVIETVSGVAYEVIASNSAIVNLAKSGENTKIFTYLSVREDAMTIYGFYSKEEKEMFIKLTSVSGVGCKVAMSVLSGMELAKLALAIVTGDSKAIAKIKGLGKKTAERIILELKEKIAAEEIDIAADALMTDSGYTPTADKDSLDAISALRSLGITQSEAEHAVSRAKPFSKTIEELIQNSLKYLNA